MTSHAEKCPVCYGEGQIKDDKGNTVAATKTCHGCGGMGWVTVVDLV